LLAPGIYNVTNRREAR